MDSAICLGLAVMGDPDLPFEVGQEVESRSFITGFRGAWFRCKICKIKRTQGTLWFALEYLDFPEEKITWTKAYQRPQPIDDKTKKTKRTKKLLMVRPRFPYVSRKHEMPIVSSSSEVVVMVNDIWKVGDMVDWMSHHCYWSGRVTQLLSDKLQIELLPPPMGEGRFYEVDSKDLRPSLDWSLKNGWMVCSLSCAQLIKLPSEGISVPPANIAGSKIDLSRFNSFENIPLEKLPLGKNTTSDMANCSFGKTSWSTVDSSSGIRVASPETAASAGEEDHNCHLSSLKKLESVGVIPLNSDFSNSLDASILDLEELATRIKWLQDILELGLHPPKKSKPSWRFLEHRA